jgi:cytochrome P450
VTYTPASSLNDVNLIDTRRYALGQPFDQWALLRAQAPVFWHEGYSNPQRPEAEITPFWAITRYHDVVRISRDPAGFSSFHGNSVSARADRPDPSGGSGLMMLTSDPPQHTRLRRLVAKGFTPQQVAKLEPHVSSIVTDILDTVAPAGACDFVADIAAELPLAVICELIGVPRSGWRRIFDLTNQNIGAFDAAFRLPGESPQETMTRSRMETFTYIRELMTERQANPQADLITLLVEAEPGGERLSDEEIQYCCFMLLVGGNETTRNAASGGLLALLEHPDQLERLRAQPALLPLAIEEILRWVSPVTHQARICTADTEVGGQHIRKGEKVVMWYPSANRDELVFAKPDAFDITRSPNEHLAFGIGEHYCIGASLARLELRVLFAEVLKRLTGIRQTGPVERLRSTYVAGIKSMPVAYTPTGDAGLPT